MSWRVHPQGTCGIPTGGYCVCLQKATRLSEAEVRNRNYLSFHFALKHLSLFFPPRLGVGVGGGSSSNNPSNHPLFLVQALVLTRPLLVAPCTLTSWGLHGTLGIGRASTFKVGKHQWNGTATVSCQLSPSSSPSNSAHLGRGLHLEPQNPRAPLPEPARLKYCLDPRCQSDLCQSCVT